VNVETIESVNQSNRFLFKTKNVEYAENFVYKGITYKTNYCLAIKDDNTLRLFKVLFFVNELTTVYVACNAIEVKTFCNHMQAYECGKIKNVLVLKPIEEFSSHPMHMYDVNAKKYVVYRSL